jgi:3-oxoacyl-[acyl-carrier protein] reductase
VLLDGRNAVIYGDGLPARVFLAGRTLAKLDEVAGAIRAAGGAAKTAQVDALDEKAVDEHADAVAAAAGGIDISFNLISHGDVQGTLLAEMALEDFTRPVFTAVTTTFLTSRAAAHHMIRQGSGRHPGVRRLGRTPARLLLCGRRRRAGGPGPRWR